MTQPVVYKFVKPIRSVQRVFIHCSASDNPAHDNVATMRQWHLARGFNDVGYHFFIRKDGTLQLGRPLERTPAAQEGNNIATIAICLHGLAKDKFTEKQLSALKQLAKQIKTAYNAKITFHGHREVSAKSCPVFDYKTVLQLDAKGYSNL